MSLKQQNIQQKSDCNSNRELCPYFRHGLCRDINACYYRHVYCKFNHACNKENCKFGHSLDYQHRLKVGEIVKDFQDYRQKIINTESQLHDLIDKMINQQVSDEDLSQMDTESRGDSSVSPV